MYYSYPTTVNSKPRFNSRYKIHSAGFRVNIQGSITIHKFPLSDTPTQTSGILSPREYQIQGTKVILLVHCCKISVDTLAIASGTFQKTTFYMPIFSNLNPVPYWPFGVILSLADWKKIETKIKDEKKNLGRFFSRVEGRLFSRVEGRLFSGSRAGLFKGRGSGSRSAF